MPKEKPNFISRSSRFNPYLHREHRRNKQRGFQIENLADCLSNSLATIVPKEESSSALNVDYFSKICDLQNPRCVEHVDSVEAGIIDVVDSMTIASEKAIDIANDIIGDLMRVFESCGYRCYLRLYGSYFTELCTTHSDVDFIFEFHEHASGTIPKDIPSSIEKILRSWNMFCKVKYIRNTRVPFIKFEHNPSKKWCNITFENKTGIKNSKLVKFYLTLNSNLKTLTLYFKHLLNKYGILGIGRITTHTLFWMVVFFMQQKGLLPPVNAVRETCSSPPEFYIFDCDWSTTSSVDNSRLYSLVLDFATFCRDFKFMKFVMSPYFGKAYPIDEVKLIGNFDLRNFATSFINLQHPLDLEFNLGKQINIGPANEFKKLCCHVSKRLSHYMRYSKECDLTLDDILFEDLPYAIFKPKELVQCTLKIMDVKDPDFLTGYDIKNGIRRLMESLFDFESTKMVEKYVNGVDGDVRTIYCFSFSSTPETWDNVHIQSILPRPKLNEHDEPDRLISVFLMCEIMDDKKIKIMIESEAHFMTFFQEYARKLLQKIFVLI